MATVGTRSDMNLRSVEPEIGNIVRAALEAAPPWLDFAVISGRRRVEDQQLLWFKGRNRGGVIVKLELVVTYKDGIEKLSRHQSGRAVDIAAYEKGKITFDQREISARAGYIIGFAAARGIKLTGGVKWDWDVGHIESFSR